MLAHDRLIRSHVVSDTTTIKPRPEAPTQEEIDQAHDDAVKEAIKEADSPDAEWVEHEDMKRWLRSWGKPDELPPPVPRRDPRR